LPQARYDILGLGNAIVDILTQAPDDFLTTHGLVKGSMSLIDEAKATSLLNAMGTTTTVSGGSAANTVIGAARLGLSAAFLGKVRNDQLGTLFAEDIREAGVHFPVAHADSGPATARCFILVTPDGQRTMNTYLGACQHLTEDDVDPTIVESSDIIYLEGYLWDPPAAKAAFVKAARLAHAAGRRVALSLSDSFCVGRYRAEFLNLIDQGLVDILFANEDELLGLYTESDLDDAIRRLQATKLLSVVTRSEKGCIVVTSETTLAVPAVPVPQLVDTTGAGDLFAAGFVTGLVRGRDLESCARLGAIAASEIIQHMGARPQVDLRDLVAADGLSL
jgi:adenosine kinase